MSWRDLLSQASVFEQLDWWSLEELAPHIVTARDNRAALCIVPLDARPRCAWVRWAAVSDDDSPTRALPALFDAQLARLRDAGVVDVRSVARRGEWFTRHLRAAEFRKIDELITLEHRIPNDALLLPEGLSARGAVAADLPLIDALDARVFPGMWRYPPDVMARALARCALFDIALADDVVVGYVCGTLEQGHAHLIRLAVAPEFERRGIGGALLDGARRALLTKGARRVTINTPASFTAIRLYRRLGYRALMEIADIYGRET
jgi:[ribosomal protein S18]-alanine N-acetyltransferase